MKNLKAFVMLLALLMPWQVQGYEVTQVVKQIKGIRYIIEAADSYVLNEQVLLVKPKTDDNSVLKNVQIVHTNELGFFHISVPKGIDIEEYATILRESGQFEIVEYVGEIKYEDFPCDTIPNDIKYGNQWYVDNINLSGAWALTTGNSNIKVAVIDSGVDAGHADLGYGNDSYTQVSTSMGYDYVNHCSYSTPTYDHGTRVAGVLAAKTNNAIGIAGVSGGNHSAGITIVPYNLGGPNEASSMFSLYLADAILDAVAEGVKVINLSLSMAQASDVISAIEYAYYHNISIVCSTGNDYASSISFPASNQYTIAVGASEHNDQRWYMSNYGEGIDLVAPGYNIYTTRSNNQYGFTQGTSFSAPMVSGVIALMLSVNPNLMPSEIYNILRNTAEKVSGYTYTNGWNQEVGYGRLDAYEAVLEALPANSQLMAVPPYESIGECYPVGTTWDEVYCSDMETPENYYYRSMLDESIYERIRYTVTSQTLQVGEQTYKSVERKWIEGVGKLDAMLADKTLYLREDNGKIYVYDNDTKKETLFYDFNKIPFLGTLLEGNYADYGMHTDGLGDGADYDVIDWYDGRFVIRGIGYSFGIISKWSMGSYEGRGMTLDSFTRNGVLVYRKTYGTPDAITAPTEQKTSERTVYDLQGRKTDASSTQSKDIIIRNGRKYINK